LHNKSVAAKSHYAFKSNFWGSPQKTVRFFISRRISDEN
jgi:hypothetical protein